MKSDRSFHNQENEHSDSSGNAPNNKIHEMFLSSFAFVLYCPRAKAKSEKFYYDNGAFDALSRTISPTPKDIKPLLSSLCSRWMKFFEEKNEMSSENDFKKDQDINTGIDFIDILKSDRRRYGVRGAVLSQQIPPPKKKQEIFYLFILERICVNYANLPMIFRSRNLNHREREIVELLLEGRCNKEIAKALGLSLNTIKVYLKLLMGKLDVSTRGGIIAVLLSGKRGRPYSTEK